MKMRLSLRGEWLPVFSSKVCEETRGGGGSCLLGKVPSPKPAELAVVVTHLEIWEPLGAFRTALSNPRAKSTGGRILRASPVLGRIAFGVYLVGTGDNLYY